MSRQGKNFFCFSTELVSDRGFQRVDLSYFERTNLVAVASLFSDLKSSVVCGTHFQSQLLSCPSSFYNLYFLTLYLAENMEQLHVGILLFCRAYLGLRNHFPSEAETLYNSLEPPYQRSLQTYLKNSGSIASLPQSDRSSSSSQESLK